MKDIKIESKYYMKKDLKKGLWLLIIGLITIFLIGNLKKELSEKDLAKYQVDLLSFDLEIEEKENCIKEKVLYYKDENGKKYYTSCLNKISDNNGYDLKKLLNTKKITFEDIISTYKGNNISFDDGGSKEYHYENLTILKCHTLVGNTDIIIGNKVLNINDGYCDREFKDTIQMGCSFTRTYLIKSKNKSVEDETEIVLSQFEGETATVKVNKYIAENFKIGKYYEFTFDNYTEKVIDNKIEDLFENYSFRTYGETDKKGLDQVQEKVCKSVSRETIKKAYNYLSKEEKEDVKEIYSAKAEYINVDKMKIINIKNKHITLTNQEVLTVEFTKDIESKVVIVLNAETKEILGVID